MAVLRSWLVPLLVGGGQAAVWVHGASLDRRPPGSLVGVLAVLGVATATVALWAVRRSPGWSLVAYVVALEFSAGRHSILLYGELALMYAVARHGSRRTTVLAGAVLLGEGLVRGYVRHEPDLVPVAVVWAVILAAPVAFGLGARAWADARHTAAGRLSAARAERRRAAGQERDRLARELHDVTAHHLTSVVVTAGAAARLSTRRPGLVGEALDHAADTGRRAAAALRQLVDVVNTPGAAEPLADRIQRLAADARTAGQPVEVTLTGLTGNEPVAALDAAHSVVREALTNALRYAPGAPVEVVVRRSRSLLGVTVTDKAPPVPAPLAGTAPGADATAGLGSGRGLAGLRDRVADVGGTLAAGPGDPAGWQVTAVLPTGPLDSTGPARRQRRLPGARDLAVLGAVLAYPVAGVLLFSEDPNIEWHITTPAAIAVTMLILILHGLPVLWRQRAPWRAAVATSGFAAAAPWLSVAFGQDPEAAGFYLLLGIAAEAVAVFAVAATARPRLGWSVVPLAAAGLLTALISTNLATGHGVDPVITAVAAAVLVLVLAPVWSAGWYVGRRRSRVEKGEHRLLADAVGATAAELDAQRIRIAAGLRASVLEPAADLVAAADAGRADPDPTRAARALDDAARHARTGLAAMRELLGALRPDAGGLTPPAGTGDLTTLCTDHRRPVTLRRPDQLPVLPLAVDISGYRIVETALCADDDPAEVWLEPRAEALRIVVTGVPGAVDGPVAARLRARVAALGGQLVLHPDGRVEADLPTGDLPTGDLPTTEVASSSPV